MLNALLRISSAAMLIGVAACTFGSTPVGQGSSNSSASKPRDEGKDADAATTTTKRRVSTRKTDARVAENEDEELDAGGGETEPQTPADAGRVVRTPTGGSSSTVTTPAETDAGQKPTQTRPQRMDAGTTTPPPPRDAGPRIGDASLGDAGDAGDAGDPIDNLEELAKMSPSARTTATINKFLMTLSEGDAPASSIKEFLTSINDEVDCKMNPLTYECLTACQAVGTTCALCILEEECRQTMLDICGVTALGGCIPRR